MTEHDTTRPAANDPTMGLEEAANFLHIGLASMKQLVASGAVPAVQLNQKHTVLLREDLVAYVREEGRRQADERRARHRRPLAATATSKPTRKARTLPPDLSRYESKPEAP
jgi:hypothetical protein